MILTYKVRHNSDFSVQLRQAKKIAEFAIRNRHRLSSKYVAHIGLKSAISNQILRKYGYNWKCKTVGSVKLSIPGQSIDTHEGKLRIKCLNLEIGFDKPCENVNQVEIDRKWCYVSISVPDGVPINPEGWVGVDRNTTGHCAVACCTKTGKVMMLGKKAQHVHEKCRKIRKKFQRLGKLRKLKQSKRKESNVVKDLNHKISRKIVDHAAKHRCGIKLEDLTGIRGNKKQAKSFKPHLHSWAYYQLQQFVEYKAQLAGVAVLYIEPAYTSQKCHACGRLGTRNGKAFECPHCGHTAHADVNAGWNIAYSEAYVQLPEGPRTAHCSMPVQPPQGGSYIRRLAGEEDPAKGTTDSPQEAPSEMQATLEPAML